MKALNTDTQTNVQTNMHRNLHNGNEPDFLIFGAVFWWFYETEVKRTLIRITAVFVVAAAATAAAAADFWRGRSNVWFGLTQITGMRNVPFGSPGKAGVDGSEDEHFQSV